MSAGTRLWKFRWQIQHNADGWNPHGRSSSISEKGEIPQPMVVGGHQDVDWYDEVDLFDLNFT
jgi:hypothetical protein